MRPIERLLLCLTPEPFDLRILTAVIDILRILFEVLDIDGRKTCYKELQLLVIE